MLFKIIVYLLIGAIIVYLLIGALYSANLKLQLYQNQNNCLILLTPFIENRSILITWLLDYITIIP